MSIAASEAEFVVDLEKIGDADGFPAPEQAQGHGLIVFLALGMKKDAMAVKVHDVERIEASIVFDVSGSQQIGLMDIVDIQCFSEIGVFHSFRSIGSFF
jgi:hypothetical protein